MGEPVDRPAKEGARLAAVSGPRFDGRFEPEGGLLELAKPLRLPAAEVEVLTLALGRVRFPLTVGGGAARFRTRRTTARRARVRLPLLALAALCAERGVRLRVVGLAPGGALRFALVDGAGPLAFEAAMLVDGADLVFAVRAARTATDGPAPALSRVLAALRPLGAALDPESGLVRLGRPLRLVLREAMAGHGWRVPDDRALRLAAPRLDGRCLVLETAAALDTPDPRELALREDARLVAPILAALDTVDLEGARAASARVVANGGAAQDRTALRELVAALGVESGEPRGAWELASLVVSEGDISAASLAASLGLRLALRSGDADAAASAARRVDACEASSALAAAALRAAATCFDASRASARAELLARAVARDPEDASLAAEAVGAVIASGDLASAERTARRSLLELAEPSDRLLVVRAAATAAGSDTAALALSSLWDDGLGLAPDDASLLCAAARSYRARKEPGAALALLDRAAASSLAAGESSTTASLLAEAASLASALGREDGAVERLVRAASIDPEAGGILASLAAAYERLGAPDAAAATYQRLLARGPLYAHVDALVAGARLHLVRTEPREARAFLEAARRVAPAHEALPSLAAEVDAAVADGWATSPGSLRAMDVFALAGVAHDASDPASVARAVLDALRASAPAADVPALVAAGRLAAERLAPADAAPLLASLADVVARVSEQVVDVTDLAALEPHATTDDARATLARRCAHLLRGAGHGGAAARALARAALVRRDAATLRAAIDLAVRAEAWDDAASIVREALEVVGDGPARAQLIARAAAISEKIGT
jgi:tetratricopeptide (TPR) repeat protein